LNRIVHKFLDLTLPSQLHIHRFGVRHLVVWHLTHILMLLPLIFEVLLDLLYLLDGKHVGLWGIIHIEVLEVLSVG